MVKKIQGLYEKYPRRIGKSKRIAYSKKDFLDYIKKENGRANVFISVFAYSNLKECDNGYKIDSDSAIIDKVFIDADFSDWIEYSYESKKKFAENIEKITKKFRLKMIEKKVVEKIINREDPTEKEIEIFIKLYKRYAIKKAENELYEKILALEHILRDWNIIRIIVFSGGGFHIYIPISNEVENKRSFCRNCINYLSNLVCNENEKYIDIKDRERQRKLWDVHCPLKLSQMARVIGTYNPKRKKYCTSLTEEEIDSGLKNLKELVKTPRTKINYLGKHIMRFPDEMDIEESIEKCSISIESGIKVPNNIISALEIYGIFWEEIPLCMQHFLKDNQSLNYEERYFIIVFLYRCGLSEGEITEILKLILTPEKLYHCTGIILENYRPSANDKDRIEHQVKSIIDADYMISCFQVKNAGYCNKLCKMKDVLYFFS